MSAAALGWAWRQQVGDPLAKLVLLKLADQANDDGEAWPARRTLANDTGTTPKMITRKIAALRDLGLVDVEERKRDNGGRTSNLYKLPLEQTPLAQRDPPPSPPRGTPPTPAGGGQEEPSLELRPSNSRANNPSLLSSRSNGDSLDREVLEGEIVSDAQSLVAYFVDESRGRGSPPPRRVVGQMARLVGELLGEGIGADRIRAGIDLVLERRLHPSTLPSAVHEAALPRPPPRVDRGRSAADLFEAARRLEEQ